MSTDIRSESRRKFLQYIATSPLLACGGLGAFGQAGVERVLEFMHAEMRGVMQQTGVKSVRELTQAHVGRG